MGTRTLDPRPTRVHGRPRPTAAGPAGSSPCRSRSIGRIITPWLSVVLVALGVGAVLGPLHAAADTAAPHGEAAAGAHRQATAKPPKQPTATQTACGPHMGAQPDTWMRDLDPCIRHRRLSDIVIPGSHDSATYGLAPQIARTQSVAISGQLNSGSRVFDIRVEHAGGNSGADYYAHHGSGILDSISPWLTLDDIFGDLVNWAKIPGHEQEIIMFSLSVTQNNTAFPDDACQWLYQQLGTNLVTPDLLIRVFGTADPGELTFDQLWSLGRDSTAARVIIDNEECITAVYKVTGQCCVAEWGPFSPPGQTLLSGYYANQCTAAGSDFYLFQEKGISVMVNDAASRRATVGDCIGGTNCEPILPGPPKVGGLYVLQVAGTPQPDCLRNPIDMFGDQIEVWDQLWDLWMYDSPAIRNNLNVVSGDYIDGNWLWVPIINMNVVPTPPDPPAITGLTSGSGQVSVQFSAPGDSGTGPITSYLVAAYDGTTFKSATGTSPDYS